MLYLRAKSFNRQLQLLVKLRAFYILLPTTINYFNFSVVNASHLILPSLRLIFIYRFVVG
jgi:hypothetical protein